MNILPVFIALLTITAAGFGILSLLLRRTETPGSISWIEAAPLSWLLGTAFVSLVMALLGTVTSGLVLLAVTTLLCALLGGIGVQSLRKKQWHLSCPMPQDALEWALCGLLLAGFAVMLAMATKETLGWDGLLVWEVKARYAFLNGGAIPHYYFADTTRAWSHSEYPLLLPMIETWIYLWLGDCDQSWVRVIFPIFYAAALLVLGSGIFRLTGKRGAGLIAAAVLFFIPYPFIGQGGVLAGYADFPLAVFYLAAVVYLLRYFREKSPSHLVLFSILAGTMPWLKREGAILWACVMLIAIADLLRRRNFRAALLTALPGLTAIVGWKIALAILKVPPGTDFLPLTLDTVRTHLHRIPSIAGELGHELANGQNWSALWFAFAIAITCLVIKGKRTLAARLFLCVALPLCIYSSTYILSAWPLYLNHITLSLSRLVLQIAPVAVLAVALAAADSPKAPAQQ